MKSARPLLLVAFLMTAAPALTAQSGSLGLPQSIAAGSAFSIPTAGSGQAVLYIVGPAQALRRDVQLGEPVSFPAGVLFNAGHYLAILVAQGSSLDAGQFDVVPAGPPASLSFLAEPSRLPVELQGGVSGTAYVFDAWRNLIVAPLPVTFQLEQASGSPQTQTVTTRNGVAWTRMNSASKEGAATFVARADSAAATRVIQEVPGDPCNLTITAQPDGQQVRIETAPLRDCSGNPIPDGTIVTFTENYNGMQSTVDVPLRHDVARVDMPAFIGATISAASGVVAGNQIRWGGSR